MREPEDMMTVGREHNVVSHFRHTVPSCIITLLPDPAAVCSYGVTLHNLLILTVDSSFCLDDGIVEQS